MSAITPDTVYFTVSDPILMGFVNRILITEDLYGSGLRKHSLSRSVKQVGLIAFNNRN